RIEGFDISNISGTFAVSSMVSFKNGRPDRQNYRRFKMKTVTGQDDFACMAETVKRRYSRLKEALEVKDATADAAREHSAVKLEDILPQGGAKPVRKATRDFNELESTEFPDEATAEVELEPSSSEDDEAPLEPFDDSTPDSPHVEPEAIENKSSRSQNKWSNVPDLILIDGGKGQLNAACAELAKLGLANIPIIGLAKEFEEIYQPGESEPLRLDHNTGALKLLQRVRDESHRFANTYNAKLRLKKISESILDEFPGIGERRKSALLKKFGSVQRLRLATLEQIAEVPGFGGKAAGELKAFLDARPGS
ncbi:MAG TPA: helix-hairpin-helix domain-containing protein, partial [Candidatus Kapabacteria bacterium]|nr:helix-hairpin-helix domain-containing protein [Candidatus Kapabacteria bacterium]